MHDEDLRGEFADWLRFVREAEPPAMPVIRRRLRRRRARNAAAGTAVLAVAVGIAAIVQLPAGPPAVATGPATATRPAVATSHPAATWPLGAASNRSIPVRGGHESVSTFSLPVPVSTLIVTGDIDQITITGSARSTPSWSEQVRYSGKRPVTTNTLTEKTLRLAYSCPDKSTCAASYNIQVPRSTAVQVTDSLGDIRLSSLSGPLQAHSSLGLITASNLSCATAVFASNLGDIDAAFAAPPATVRATSRLGAITIRVPGTASYDVSTQVGGLGTASVTVPRAASSRHAITASTDMGAIVISPL